MAEHRSEIVVGVVGAAVLVALGVVRGVATVAVYAGVTVVGAAVALAVLRRGVSRAAAWGIVAFGLGNLAGGVVPVGEGVLYGWWLAEPVVRFDNVQHAVGFGAVGRVAWELLRGRLGPAGDTTVVVGFTIVAAGCTAGAVNEIVEGVMTATIPAVDVGGYANTVRDLVANLVGSLAWAAATVARPVRVSPSVVASRDVPPGG